MLQLLKAEPKDLSVIVSFSNRYSYEELKKLLNKDFVKIYKLQKEKEILGYAVVWEILEEAELHWFEIFKPFRGRGLSIPFMELLIRVLSKEGIKKLLLEVSEKNKVALKVYKASGFKTVGIRKNYYPDGSDAILMEKELTDSQQTL